MKRQRTALCLVALLLAGALLPVATTFAQSAQRIDFAPGATSANVRGVASTGAPAAYVLRADAGQTLRITANYVNNTYEVLVTAPSGANLGVVETGRPWSSVLPASGDYGLTVVVPPMYTGNVFFNLDISITGGSGPAPAPSSGPQRITFPPGATSATVTGQVVIGRPAVYVLRALAGQEMTVRGDGPGPFMTILTGADGSFLDSANANQPIQVRLPTTQDYYISLQAPTDVPASIYSLTVTVVTPGQPTPSRPTRVPTAVPTAPSPQGPQRINFRPGATQATVSGVVGAGQPTIFVLRALAGQTMTVRGDGPGSFTLLVTGADGNFLGSTPANTPLTVRLPTTQDYYLTLQGMDAVPSNFLLTVSVVSSGQPTPSRPTPTPAPARPQRINFASGETAANVSGQVTAGAPVVYVLRALAGQTMSVYASSANPFRVSITGANGAFLASGSANESVVTRLPATQDYFITLEAPIGGAGAARYNMTVSVVGSTRPTPQPSTQRIRFAPGATSAAVSGYTPQRYALGARGGQTMYVELSASGPATFVISGADGRRLGSGSNRAPWSGQLPATQDYFILVEGGDGSSGVGYSMTVSIY